MKREGDLKLSVSYEHLFRYTNMIFLLPAEFLVNNSC